MKSQMNEYRKFAEGERRGLSPGKIDLVFYVAWILCDDKVQILSLKQYTAIYLSAIKTFCERRGMRPFPPPQTELSLLEDALKAVARFKSEMSAKKFWLRSGVPANQIMLVLQHMDADISTNLISTKFQSTFNISTTND